jgi:hypothetical protein
MKIVEASKKKCTNLLNLLTCIQSDRNVFAQILGHSYTRLKQRNGICIWTWVRNGTVSELWLLVMLETLRIPAWLACLKSYRIYQSSNCAIRCPPYSTRGLARSIADWRSPSKFRVFPLGHNSSPRGTEILLHHELKWHKLNVRNTPTITSVG